MNLSDPRFQDANKARTWLEAQRWPDGPVCPHCGNADPEKIKGLKGKVHRPGLYQCAECREQFTVTVGSVMERSKIPLNKWLLAMHLMGSSKKGMSAHQLHRMLGITYQSAWFLAHRIREAMKPDSKTPPLGGRGKTIEADETYLGRTSVPAKRIARVRGQKKPNFGPGQKRAVLALVERGGNVRSFHLPSATADSVREALFRNVSRKSVLHTDESQLYVGIGRAYASHETVKHSAKEYVRGDVHTNTVEGFFSIFKRGMKGVYQHCSEAHLHRYLAEFDFRYNNRSGLGVEDTERTAKLIKQTEGKRLTYRRTDQSAYA